MTCKEMIRMAHTGAASAGCTVVDLPVAAQMLGIGRTFAYQLVREGRWPTPVIRVGRLIKVPVAPLREYLGDPKATVA
jgi:excisionase family DNA binding protein